MRFEGIIAIQQDLYADRSSGKQSTTLLTNIAVDSSRIYHLIQLQSSRTSLNMTHLFRIAAIILYQVSMYI